MNVLEQEKGKQFGRFNKSGKSKGVHNSGGLI